MMLDWTRLKLRNLVKKGPSNRTDEFEFPQIAGYEMKISLNSSVSKRSSLLPDVLDETELVLLRLAPPGEGTF